MMRTPWSSARKETGGPMLAAVAAHSSACRTTPAPIRGDTRIGSPHRVAPTISRGEPVRSERIASCGQLPLPLGTTSVAVEEVFAGLPDEVRQCALVLLARLIARAALEVDAAGEDAR